MKAELAIAVVAICSVLVVGWFSPGAGGVPPRDAAVADCGGQR